MPVIGYLMTTVDYLCMDICQAFHSCCSLSEQSSDISPDLQGFNSEITAPLFDIATRLETTPAYFKAENAWENALDVRQCCCCHIGLDGEWVHMNCDLFESDFKKLDTEVVPHCTRLSISEHEMWLPAAGVYWGNGVGVLGEMILSVMIDIESWRLYNINGSEEIWLGYYVV